MKTTTSEHVVYINCSECQNKNQFVYTTCSELVFFLYWTHNSMNNMLSYCGLVDARISASGKDLPVRIVSFSFCSYFSHCNNGDHIPNSNWGGLNLLKFLAVESRDVSQAVKKITVAKAFQRWANSQNDNYFHSKAVILSENSCHFVSCPACNNSYFLFNLRWVTC